MVWTLVAPCAWALGLRRAWRDRCVHWWGSALVVALGIRVRRVGEIPTGGCLIVSNHLSYVDILVLASQRPLIFLSKAEVASWPGIGWMARAVGVLFVQRGDKRSLPAVAALLGAELEAGRAVVLFPEGTSSRGAEVLPFRASLLAPAAEGQAPVAYAALSYRTPEGHPAASQSVCWWGDMTFADHLIRLLKLPYVDAEIRFGSERFIDRDRKVLAQRLWQAVQAQFVPVA
ncbi:lysophospholipid acyltransferase family protein [Engelhardtia mirabilis]|uniref:2-acyl-glycerophospho-ethanolamine acyltransferase n=1 Tax=Engelhardtia mirabilis TaxID=2528011 RepID=A0A518BF46_9BACT|nr:2-acyl-glycerophospho-ethanolamine acyltransferase [Planctomycetes bacterium Pla133]QDU99911.1 2-acyl-glycerophospho-ethanolamine acyltransferase [Planctomycetes bacterium Pla86]